MTTAHDLGWLVERLRERHDEAERLPAVRFDAPFEISALEDLHYVTAWIGCDACALMFRVKPKMRKLELREFVVGIGGFYFVTNATEENENFYIISSSSTIPCKKIFALQALWELRREIIDKYEGQFGKKHHFVLALKTLIYSPLVFWVSRELEK